jgi:hypothetical protein
MSTDGLGKFVRAAVVSGVLGTAGLVAVAGPVHAQDNGTDNGTDSGTGSSTTAAPTTTRGGSGNLPNTGGVAGTSLALGGAAVGIALAGRRLLASRA